MTSPRPVLQPREATIDLIDSHQGSWWPDFLPFKPVFYGVTPVVPHRDERFDGGWGPSLLAKLEQLADVTFRADVADPDVGGDGVRESIRKWQRDN